MDLYSRFKRIIPKHTLWKTTSNLWMICDICKEASSENLKEILSSFQLYINDDKNLNQDDNHQKETLANFVKDLEKNSADETIKILRNIHLFPHLMNHKDITYEDFLKEKKYATLEESVSSIDVWIICKLCKSATSKNLNDIIISLQTFIKDPKHLNQNDEHQQDVLNSFIDKLKKSSPKETIVILKHTDLFPHLINQQGSTYQDFLIQKKQPSLEENIIIAKKEIDALKATAA